MMQWLLQLLPQQKAKGQGNVQAGNVGGDFSNTQNNSQAVYIFITNEQTQQHAVVPSPVEVVPEPAVRPVVVSQAIQAATSEQLFILRIMRHEPELGPLAVRFMEKHFQTSYVKGLDAQQAYRVRRYLETCASNRIAKAGKKVA